MSERNWVDVQKDKTRSVHAQKRRVDAVDRLKVLRTFKCQRRAGYSAAVMLKRLRTTRKVLRRWAQELGFDLEGTL
jgi:hypothetical protein